jgi:flagellar hook-length control protein FliK
LNATPIADLLLASAATAQGTPGDKGAAADLLFAELDPAAASPRAASTFAALLQDAAFGAADALGDERLPDVETEVESGPVAQAPSALDTLLFLANVPGAQPAAAAPATQSVVPQSPDASADESDIPVLTAVVAPSPVAEGGATGALTPDRGASSRLAPVGIAARDAAADAPPVAVAQAEVAFESMLAPRDDAPVAVPSAAAPVDGLAASTTFATQGAGAAEPAPFGVHVQHAATAPRSDAVVPIHTPVSHPAWRDEAAERMASLVTRGVERAELRLSPAELGPVEVRIDVRGSEATLAIVAAQPTTRDALEQALPALRDLLSQQGLSLGEATVRDGRADGQPSHERGSQAARPFDDRGPPQHDEPATGVRRSVRLVDTFA